MRRDPLFKAHTETREAWRARQPKVSLVDFSRMMKERYDQPRIREFARPMFEAMLRVYPEGPDESMRTLMRLNVAFHAAAEEIIWQSLAELPKPMCGNVTLVTVDKEKGIVTFDDVPGGVGAAADYVFRGGEVRE